MPLTEIANLSLDQDNHKENVGVASSKQGAKVPAAAPVKAEAPTQLAQAIARTQLIDSQEPLLQVRRAAISISFCVC